MISPFICFYLTTSWRTEAGQAGYAQGKKLHRCYKTHGKNWRQHRSNWDHGKQGGRGMSYCSRWDEAGIY